MERTRKILNLSEDLVCSPEAPVVEENHVHFTLDSSLSTIRDVLRPESDCILIARPGAVTGLGPVITHNRYVLTDQTVPFSRFCGVWSFVDRSWLVYTGNRLS